MDMESQKTMVRQYKSKCTLLKVTLKHQNAFLIEGTLTGIIKRYLYDTIADIFKILRRIFVKISQMWKTIQQGRVEHVRLLKNAL